MIRWILVFLVIGVLSVSTYFLTAANIVPSGKAGEGAGTIGSYAVSSIQYVLDTNDPRNIDQVTLTLNAAAATVKVKVVSSSANWYTCTLLSGFNWGCATTSPQVTAANAVSGGQLRVIAVQ
ncbi:MAG: hypothetical protein Q8N39_00800 [Pelolinea sp.]|nr:hypothetical protein [Pelolinea sp.]